MKKTDTNWLNTLFAKNFVGLEVELMINLYHKVEEHSEDGMLAEQSPLMVRGYILDLDEYYIYLGDTPDAITKFVKKELVCGGDLVQDSGDGLDDMLNNMPEGNMN